MAEVIQVLGHTLDLDGTAYTAQVCGRAAGNIWEGWIEFIAADGGDVRRTGRETTQPDRAALEYWAGGLSATYLEGALARAIAPPPARVAGAVSRPYFEAPAPPPPPEMVVVDRAVLDPFSVGAKGTAHLRSELNALADWHLHNIIRAYELADAQTPVEQLPRAELIELIVAAVEPV
jgi:hypothetical protein